MIHDSFRGPMCSHFHDGVWVGQWLRGELRSGSERWCVSSDQVDAILVYLPLQSNGSASGFRASGRCVCCLLLLVLVAFLEVEHNWRLEKPFFQFCLHFLLFLYLL